MSTPFYKQGLQFECTQCHACCRHDPGYVFLSEADLERLANHFAISADDFVQKYCRWVDLGNGPVLSLLEKKNYDCIFWDQGCSVYLARPLQCRTYPFWEGPLMSKEKWNWEARFCPGMNHGATHEAAEIEAALEARRQNPVIKKDSV